MNIRKVLAGGLAAITAGATIALGAAAITSLGDYVTTTDGTLSSPIIVIGDTVPAGGLSQAETIARTKDVLGGADIAAAVAGYATTTVATGAGAAVAVSGGADLSTTSTKLYLGSVLNTAKDTITSDDLPTILAAGKVTDTAGTEYNYAQYIYLGGTAEVKFGTSGTSLAEGTPIIELTGTGSTAELYNASIVFSNPLDLNASAGTANVDGKSITMFGNSYTLGSGTELSDSKLTLYGGGIATTIPMGESEDVTIAGTTYTIKIIGISTDGNTAYITVDAGETMTATEGSYISLAAGVTAYVKTVALYGTGLEGSVTIRLGADKVVLENGQSVRTGTNLDPVKGTRVTVTSGGTNKISAVTIQVYKPDNTNDYIAVGTPFADPVFKTFKTAFGGFTPALDSAARSTITAGVSGDNTATLTMTDYNGVEKTIEFASNYYPSGTAGAPSLRDSNNQSIVVVENATVNMNDYVIINPNVGKASFSHLLQFIAADLTGTTKTLTLRDQFSEKDVTVTVADGNIGTTGTAVIDGKTYTFEITGNISAAESIVVRDSVTGTTVFPTLVGNNDEEVAIVDEVTVAGGTDVVLPGDATAYTLLENVYTFLRGQINYTFDNTTDKLRVTATSNPAILVWEEKDVDTNRDAVIAIISNETIGAAQKITVDTSPSLTGTDSGFIKTTNTYITKALDYYGTLVTRDTTDQGQIIISYPDDQAVATVGIGSDPTFSVGGVGTVEVAVKITSPVSKLAGEVSETAPGADLILIGGPCANSLTAIVMAADNVTCGDWPYTTGIIKEYTGAFTDGSRALVVAGTTADDTRSLAAQVMAGTLSYAV